MSVSRLLRRIWPLTLFGTFAFIGAVALLSASLAEKNTLGTIVASLGLALVFLSCAVSWSQALRARAAPHSLGVPDAIRRGPNARAFALSLDEGLLPVTRFHASLFGRIEIASRVAYRIHGDFCSPGGGSDSFPFDFPSHGVAIITGQFYVGDILGIARCSVDDIAPMNLAILPRPLRGIGVSVDRQSLSEDTQTARKTAGHERLLVREYAPGDLVRDINWKAAARLGSLLTKIPPESPRETTTIRVFIVMPQEGSTRASRARSLVEISHIGCLAVSFMYSARARYPGCAFAVCLGSAGASSDIAIGSDESPDAFLAKLARAPFSPGGRDSVARIPDGAWVIGSSSDACLSGALGTVRQRGNTALLSRFVGYARNPDADDFFTVPLISRFPLAVWIPLSGILSACARERSAARGSSPAEIFDCGVRS